MKLGQRWPFPTLYSLSLSFFILTDLTHFDPALALAVFKVPWKFIGTCVAAAQLAGREVPEALSTHKGRKVTMQVEANGRICMYVVIIHILVVRDIIHEVAEDMTGNG